MATKVAAKKKVAVEKVEDKLTVLTDVKAYARKVWLAGLGAYAKAGAEGAEYFKELVKAGEGVEKKGKKLVDQQVDAANSQIDAVKNSVAEAKGKVEGRFEQIEQAFDKRVASGLNRLGSPSRQDIDALSARLDALNALLEQAAKNK